VAPGVITGAASLQETIRMRISPLATLPLLGALLLAPRQGSAQISATIHLGSPVVVTNYSPQVHGDWHTNYSRWKPTTVYAYNGQYYNHSVRGARPVQIYHRQNQYFLPPQDPAWANRGDKRYNYNRKPTDDDYNHAAPPPERRP
jgi:hypothetical protein